MKQTALALVLLALSARADQITVNWMPPIWEMNGLSLLMWQTDPPPPNKPQPDDSVWCIGHPLLCGNTK